MCALHNLGRSVRARERERETLVLVRLLTFFINVKLSCKTDKHSHHSSYDI